MRKFLLFALLFILPFLVVPFGTSQFELPKIIAAQIIIDALFLLIIVREGKNFLKSQDRKHLIILSVIVILCIYHLLFLATPITFFGNSTRLQGVLLLFQLMLFSLISSRVRLPKVSSVWYLAILIITFVLALFIGNQNARAIATLGEPNALSAFVIFLWPFIYFGDFKTPKIKTIYRTSGIVLALGIVLLAGSMSGLIALAIQIIFLILLTKINVPLKKVIFVSFLLLAAAYMLPLFEHTPYENRIDVWKNAALSGLAHPFLGGGFGNTQIQIRQTSLDLHDKLIGYYVDSGHNIFLDWWIQGGLAGVSILLLLIVNTIRNLYAGKKTTELVILFGLITMLSFNPAGIVALLGFWWLIGQGFAQQKE